MDGRTRMGELMGSSYLGRGTVLGLRLLMEPGGSPTPALVGELYRIDRATRMWNLSTDRRTMDEDG